MKNNVDGDSPVLVPVRVALALGVVMLFFSQLAQFAFQLDLSPVPPTYVFFGTAVLFAMVVVADPGVVCVDRAVLAWSLYYATLTAIGFWISSSSLTATDEVIGRYRALVFLLIVVMVSSGERFHRVSRSAVVAVVIFATILNVIDVIRPMTFTETLGRSAGLYQNPNISGGAIGMGVLLGMPVLARAWRPWFLVIAGLGVLLTLSRGSLLAFAATSLILFAGGEVPVRRTLTIGAVVTVIVGLGVWVGGEAGAVAEALRLSLVESGTLDRLVSIGANSDASSSARATVAEAAIAMFSDAPWLGHGLAATLEWRFAESTHNMYLRHVAEYGVGGVFLIPALVYLIARRRVARYRFSNYALAVFVMIWALFSHNLLDEWPAVASIGIALSSPRQQTEGDTA